MPFERWVHDCPVKKCEVTLGTPVCSECGQPGQYDGWHLSMIERMAAYCQQTGLKPIGKEPLHHSDRGCQYTSDAYQQTLRTLGIECSMSRSGECYDNAVIERFFWSLKHEWTKHETFDDLEAVRLSVFKYIVTFYNTKRLHQTLGYKSPDHFEAVYAPVIAA